MADEDKIQRQIEFIIEQQAQFATDIQQLRESQAANENLLGRLAVVTTSGFNELNEKFSVLVDAQIRTEDKVSTLSDNVSTLTEKMTELAEAQVHTDQRLSALIDIVSEMRNGKSQN
jgi:predicted nuclease with TOPRIM domain